MAIEQNQNYLHTGEVEFQGGVKIVNGAEGVGKVLTSDASGNASWTSSSAGVIQSVTRLITSAELLQIHTTPIELVSAQGVGTVLCPIQITVWLNYNTIQYATDVALRLFYDDNVTLLVNMGAILDKTADFYLQRSVQTTSSWTGANLAENVNLAISTGLSNPTVGDSDVKITLLYAVITI
jgi:hypothetical protein